MYVFVFFFKQKTADEMRISDWSSDVCSSDLESARAEQRSLGSAQHLDPFDIEQLETRDRPRNDKIENRDIVVIQRHRLLQIAENGSGLHTADSQHRLP